MVGCSRDVQEGGQSAPVVEKEAAAAVETPSTPKFLNQSPLVVEGGEVHDIGTVNFYDEVPIVFSIKNTGDRPFPLNDVSSSCSCTVVDLNGSGIDVRIRNYQ